MRRNNKIYRLLVIVLILCLSIGYAVLNSTLKINGTSNIQKNTWDVHFESIYIVDGSVEPVVEPTISDDVNINFELTLDKPGDYFEFYVDVVNRGTIDAMISSFQKTPDLSEEQKKYINYIIEYQNGEQITKNQLVKANSFSRLKVKVEYKKDLTASDLPTTDESLNLGFIVNYVQADESGSLITNNGSSNGIVTIKSGNGRQTGDEVCIKNECFYVVSENEDTITLFAKYNLMVGNRLDEGGVVTPLENPSGLQSEFAKGIATNSENVFPVYGTVSFSENTYWFDSESVSLKPQYYLDLDTVFEGDHMVMHYVYDENSSLYEPLENYKSYLVSQGVSVNESRLIKASELFMLSGEWDGETDTYLYDWLYSTSYWTGAVCVSMEDDSFNFIPWGVFYNEIVYPIAPDTNLAFGLRPVIEISLSELYSNKK